MNEKSVLVIDTPKSCAVCPIFQDRLDGYCPVALLSPYNKYNERDKHCPLKPLPKKKKSYMAELTQEDYDSLFPEAKGYNACLDEILGDYITQEEADLCGVQLWHDD